MTKFKPFIVLSAVLFTLVLIIPALLVVLPFGNDEKQENREAVTAQKKKEEATPFTSMEPAVDVAVYRTDAKKVETFAFEDYLIGVVASEMPAEFELEALKAQALAARTYTMQHLLADEGSLPDGAMITDSTDDQVFKNKEELKKIWKSDYDWKIEKITQAVQETSGQILTYDGNPITAAFFSTSNGYTENAENVWANATPYLKSVKSPWDIDTPKFADQISIPVSEFEKKLNVKVPSGQTVAKIVEKTDGNRIGKVDINGTMIKGTDVRMKLGLQSTDFTLKRNGDQINIQTKGYGHGVGMSQYGANGMAKEGKSYKEIVSYYYKGIEISESDTMVAKLTAQK
ncbi:stage II sporulation protein D [Cytobacillus kochii]